jgi:hypothetical protein
VGAAKARAVSKKPQVNAALALILLEGLIHPPFRRRRRWLLPNDVFAWSWGHEPAAISRSPQDRLVSPDVTIGAAHGSLAGIAAFVRVVENGGFAAAARHLNVSRTRVSSHVHELEDRLGARLLNRTTRKVSLTEIGREHYERSTQ